MARNWLFSDVAHTIQLLENHHKMIVICLFKNEKKNMSSVLDDNNRCLLYTYTHTFEIDLIIKICPSPNEFYTEIWWDILTRYYISDLLCWPLEYMELKLKN